MNAKADATIPCCLPCQYDAELDCQTAIATAPPDDGTTVSDVGDAYPVRVHAAARVRLPLRHCRTGAVAA